MAETSHVMSGPMKETIMDQVSQSGVPRLGVSIGLVKAMPSPMATIGSITDLWKESLLISSQATPGTAEAA
eukprot:14671375-Ditylum_brightwellii.AAC.1